MGALGLIGVLFIVLAMNLRARLFLFVSPAEPGGWAPGDPVTQGGGGQDVDSLQ